MSTPTEEIEIDLNGASQQASVNATQQTRTEKKDEIVVEPSEEPAKKPPKQEISTEEGLDKLRADLAAEKTAREEADRRRIAAEARANEAAQGEAAAKTEVQTTQLDFVKGAIDRVKGENLALKSQLASAYAAQDFDKVADIQMQMAENGGRLAQLEAGKNALEKAPKVTPRVPEDPVERFIGQRGLTPASAAWIRSHPEYATDNQKTGMMIAAHNLAIGRGLKPESAEYFGDIEQTLRITSTPPLKQAATTEDDALSNASRPTTTRTPSVAPVSRTNVAANRMRLTADQREMARMSFPEMKPDEAERAYAANLLALKAEGKLQ